MNLNLFFYSSPQPFFLIPESFIAGVDMKIDCVLPSKRKVEQYNYFEHFIEISDENQFLLIYRL